MFVLSHLPKKAQLRAPLSPLQTAWTGFDPNLYSSGSSSAGPALVEIATARSFILDRGIVTDNVCHTPGARMTTALVEWWSGMHCSPSRLQGCDRHCVSYNAPVEYKGPCSCYSTKVGPAEDDPPLYKLGLKPVQAVCKGESGALN